MQIEPPCELEKLAIVIRAMVAETGEESEGHGRAEQAKKKMRGREMEREVNWQSSLSPGAFLFLV